MNFGEVIPDAGDIALAEVRRMQAPPAEVPGPTFDELLERHYRPNLRKHAGHILGCGLKRSLLFDRVLSAGEVRHVDEVLRTDAVCVCEVCREGERF